MIRALLALALLASSSLALAAQRSVGIGSFDRLRITGPIQVSVATGRSPAATIVADPRTIDDVELHADGATLVVRMRPGVAGAPPRGGSASPIQVTLATPSLSMVAVIGGAKVTVGAMKGDRIDASIAGSGGLTIASADAAQVDATLIGAGAMAIGGGHAARVRLIVNGPGGIDAGALDAGDLVVRVEGLGDTKARARYTADVTSAGQGSVTVTGNPKCTIRGVPGGTVTCGR
ncbi:MULTISPECIES: DUF2807 domain-containing protein [unclassified Sphingomonas]|uniref:GIN domain-containing protein n=1 Tax=unclassified Sphingomonas TaxID=196159 RepID=UPI00226A3826|nr:MULTISPECIES: DUF2807 domain-containing protein [unclassified Sphingomonas]